MFFFFVPVPLGLILLLVLLWKPMQKITDANDNAYNAADDKVAYVEDLFRRGTLGLGLGYAFLVLIFLFDLLLEASLDGQPGTAFLLLVCFMVIVGIPFAIFRAIWKASYKTCMAKARADRKDGGAA